MKDFFAEEIEGKTATLILPKKPIKKDFYSEEIGDDFYSKEVKPSLKLEKPVAMATKIISEAIKPLLFKKPEIVKKGEAQLAREALMLPARALTPLPAGLTEAIRVGKKEGMLPAVKAGLKTAGRAFLKPMDYPAPELALTEEILPIQPFEMREYKPKGISGPLGQVSYPFGNIPRAVVASMLQILPQQAAMKILRVATTRALNPKEVQGITEAYGKALAKMPENVRANVLPTGRLERVLLGKEQRVARPWVSKALGVEPFKAPEPTLRVTPPTAPSPQPIAKPPVLAPKPTIVTPIIPKPTPSVVPTVKPPIIAKPEVTTPKLPITKVIPVKKALQILPTKEQLLIQIDEAIKKAPDIEMPTPPIEPDPAIAKKEDWELYRQKLADYNKQIEPLGKISFQTDGGAKIYNTKQSLQQFKDIIAKTPKTMGVEKPISKGITASSATFEKVDSLVEIENVKDYFTDGKMIVKGQPPKSAKFVEGKKVTKEDIDRIFETKTEPAEKLYYYIDDPDGTQGVSSEKIAYPSKVDYIPKVIFKKRDEYFNYDQFRFNVLDKRFPNAKYEIDKNGLLIAFEKGERVAALLPMATPEGTKFTTKAPLEEIAINAGLLKPKVTKPSLLKPQITKDYYAEEVETPSAFAGVIAEEMPAITAPSAEIVKRSQIISNLGEKLNVPIRRGGFGGAERATRMAAGIYKPRPDIIRWKSGGVGTISHEIGHFLDDNFKDLSDLIKASRPEIGPLDYDPMKQRANEGFSEFLRYWITQPQIAQQKAPQFHTQFEGWLNNNPDVRTVLNSAREDYQAWLKMPSIDKVKSQISFEPETQAQGIKHTVDSLYNKIVDELAPIQRYVDLAKKQGIKILDEENPYVLARLLKGNTGKANHFLNHKTFNTKLEITGKGLREVLEPVKNNLEDFSTYLVAKRVPELKARGKETGVSKQDALNTILELGKKYPRFKGVTEELYAYQDRLLQYAFENGLISPMGLVRMKELNKNYVPFYRVFEELQRKGYMGDTLANLSSPIKRMTYRGSEREIIDPIESIMKNTYAIINTSDRNAVVRGMIILSKQDKELGRLLEKIATPLSKVATVDLGKEVNKILAEEGDELPENDINMIIDIFRPSFFTPKENTITVMQGGKKEFYYVDPDIYKAMLGLEKEEMSMLIKVLSYPARWLRAGATSLSPEFLARNPLRDQFSAYVYSKTGYAPVVDLPRGMFNLFGKSDLYWEWVRGGGEHATIVSVDREYMRQNLKELFNRNWKDAINPLRWMQAVSEFGEQGTRLGEFVRGRKKGFGIKESAFTARNVTLDFAKMGSKIKTWNRITAFLNANIQGLFRPAQAFRERPVATWFKILTGITLPSIILYLMNRDDERYKELPRWQRDSFWIVRVPANTPSGEILLRIPKPFELGIIFGTVPERILEYIDSQDPQAFDKLRDTIIEGAYLNPKQWIPTALVPVLENMTNWSFFRERKLETMGMERLLPEERYTAFTSETAKKLGRILGYSPAKIENLVSGYTGAGGQLTLDLLDFLVTGGRRKLPLTPENIPVIRGFIAREPIGSFSESLNKFYENYEKITKVYNTMQEANKTGNREKFDELRRRYPEINPFTNAMVVRESKRLSEGRKEINKILDSDDTPEIKLSKMRKISIRMTEIAQETNNRLKE